VCYCGLFRFAPHRKLPAQRISVRSHGTPRAAALVADLPGSNKDFVSIAELLPAAAAWRRASRRSPLTHGHQPRSILAGKDNASRFAAVTGRGDVPAGTAAAKSSRFAAINGADGVTRRSSRDVSKSAAAFREDQLDISRRVSNVLKMKNTTKCVVIASMAAAVLIGGCNSSGTISDGLRSISFQLKVDQPRHDEGTASLIVPARAGVEAAAATNSN